MVQLKILDPLDLDAVILTHYHHDHIADLGVLQYYWQLYPGNEERQVLPIYGHGEDAVHFESLTMPGVTQGIDYLQMESLELGPFTITFMKTIHPVTCYAMRFVEKSTGKVFVFTGDSGYLESFVPFAQGADLFLQIPIFLQAMSGTRLIYVKRSREIAHAAQVKN